MPGQVDDNPARAAEDEALAIANGLPRGEIDRRAWQAFQSANDIRARYRGLPDAAKRAAAVSRARTWAEILHHMDDTEETEFCGCLDDDTQPLAVQVVWAVWDFLAMLTSWLNVVAVLRTFRDVVGSEPITFYEWPETSEGNDT
jgi:hypothetical protein